MKVKEKEVGDEEVKGKGRQGGKSGERWKWRWKYFTKHDENDS